MKFPPEEVLKIIKEISNGDTEIAPLSHRSSKRKAFHFTLLSLPLFVTVTFR